jgi:hypothetical protein
MPIDLRKYLAKFILLQSSRFSNLLSGAANTQEALGMFASERHGMIAICEKDVPSGLPYKIVNDEDIPTDRTFRSAWEWDNSIVPDGFGGLSNEFDNELLKKYKGII